MNGQKETTDYNSDFIFYYNRTGPGLALSSKGIQLGMLLILYFTIIELALD